MAFIESFLRSSLRTFRYRAELRELPGLRDLNELSELSNLSGGDYESGLPSEQSIISDWNDAREVVGRWRESTPTEYWPEVITVTNPGISTKFSDMFSADTDSSLSRLGLSLQRIPPDARLLDFIESDSSIESVWSGETPHVLSEPEEGARDEMFEARSMVKTPVRNDRALRRTRVGIVDSGIDLAHSDFRSISSDRARNFTEDSNVLDYRGHGTHVSGIVAGLGTLSGGRFAGMAPESDLVIAKVLNSQGTGSTSGILRGLAWAYTKNVDVLNLSLGSPIVPGHKSPLTIACENLADLGIIMVISAGNDGPGLATISSPGDGDGVVTVGAINKDFDLAYFSSRGSPTGGGIISEKPDIVAPGVSVVAPRSRYCSYPAYPKNSYASLSGTSMASPVVAGLAARLLSYVDTSNRVERARVVEQALISTASPDHGSLGSLRRYEIGVGVPD